MAVSILANLTNSIVHTGQRMTWPPVCFQFISNREKMLPRYVVVAGSLNHCPRPSRLTLLRVGMVVLYTDCWGRNTTVAGQSNHASCIHFIRYPACLYKGPTVGGPGLTLHYARKQLTDMANKNGNKHRVSTQFQRIENSHCHSRRFKNKHDVKILAKPA